MPHYKDFVSDRLRNEDGHLLAFEWSVFLYLSLILIAIMLPDIFTIGRAMHYTHQAASYAAIQAAENGGMTEEIAEITEQYLASRGIRNYQIWATDNDELIDLGETIEVIIITQVQPKLLRIIPEMRVSDRAISTKDGVVEIMARKLDVSSVYTRGNGGT